MKLTSSRTQLPYEYYSLPFCKPDSVFYKAENLGESGGSWSWSTFHLGFLCFKINAAASCCLAGEVLRGDRIVNTLYTVEMNKDKKCEIVCNKKKLSVEDSKLIAERIQEEYYIHL